MYCSNSLTRKEAAILANIKPLVQVAVENWQMRPVVHLTVWAILIAGASGGRRKGTCDHGLSRTSLRAKPLMS